MFSFIVASGSTTRRSSSIFSRQLSTSSFFAPIFKRQQSIRIDKNNKDIFHESRKRVKGIPTLATRLFSCTSTCDDDDNDDEDNHFRFPPLRGNILVVGDGDFSYSVALAKENQAQGDAKITASSLDTKDFIEETYSKGKANLEILDHDSNVQLKHELDVTEIGSLGKEKIWDSIVWNFPYPANCINFSNATIQEGSVLLTGFFSNISLILKRKGILYVTLAFDQGEKRAWDIDGIAQRTGLPVIKGLPFSATNIEGYEPKRAYTDKRVAMKQACTYVLCRRNDYYQILSHNERKSKLKKKYFSELASISTTRRDLYNTCFTPQQAYDLLKEEQQLMFKEFLELYGENFGVSRSEQIDTLEKLSTSGNSEVIDSLNLLSYEGHFTVEEIHKILDDEVEINLDQFNGTYKSKFGKDPIYIYYKLVATLKLLSNIGNFYVEERPDGSNHLVAECYSAEIQELLKECDGELQATNFRGLFKNKYGRAPFSDRVKMKEALEKICHSGRFLLEMRGNFLWITIRYCTAEEMSELLTESDGEIYVGRFRDIYEQKFGRPPFTEGLKLKDALDKLSHSGTFQLETRRGGLWITLPPGTK